MESIGSSGLTPVDWLQWIGSSGLAPVDGFESRCRFETEIDSSRRRRRRRRRRSNGLVSIESVRGSVNRINVSHPSGN